MKYRMQTDFSVQSAGLSQLDWMYSLRAWQSGTGWG